MTKLRTALAAGGTVVVVAAGLLAAGTLAGSPKPDSSPEVSVTSARDPLLVGIERAQERLKVNPKDAQGWAGLGVAYVQRARDTGDPSWYTKAEGAVGKSFALDTKDNFLAFAGEAALKNAQHNFRGAETAARKGIAINGFNSTLYGALGDALTQLGRYDEAAQAVDKMNQLLPGVPAFTRASYVFELRGDVKGATTAMQRALDTTRGAARAFPLFFLGELSLRYGGDAKGALAYYQEAQIAAPDDAIVRGGLAKAEAALGMTEQAIEDYQKAVNARPEPITVLEFARLLESLGDPRAKQQFDLFRIQAKLYRASGVVLDTEATLFEADHGDPAAALRNAKAGWATRPFVEMADAYAWALHANKRYAEALTWSQKAFASGWKPALALFHRGMIQHELGNKAAAKADLTAALAQDPFFDPIDVKTARATLATL